MIPQRIIYKDAKLLILDQRLIPYKTKYFLAKTAKDVAFAIKQMMVRGAPLIGDCAAYGYLLGVDEIVKKNIKDKKKLIKILDENAKLIKSSRPTALALFKATNKVHNKAIEYINSDNKFSLFKLREIVKTEVENIIKEDIKSTIEIAKNGIKLLNNNSTIITYCNTGALATAGIGTAFGIISYGYKNKKVKFVYPCETRPYLQGSRLTAWELLKNKIPFSLICDNMAGWLMKTKKIDAVIIGADRIASNGDSANKIGSYSLAILSKYHKIPFYVAAPIDTIDMNIKTGNDIVIEERSSDEVIKIKSQYIADPKTQAYYVAFDVVPNNLITAIITEKGIINNPSYSKIKNILNS